MKDEIMTDIFYSELATGVANQSYSFVKTRSIHEIYMSATVASTVQIWFARTSSDVQVNWTAPANTFTSKLYTQLSANSPMRFVLRGIKTRRFVITTTGAAGTIRLTFIVN